MRLEQPPSVVHQRPAVLEERLFFLTLTVVPGTRINTHHARVLYHPPLPPLEVEMSRADIGNGFRDKED
jgi:hypothetical protein